MLLLSIVIIVAVVFSAAAAALFALRLRRAMRAQAILLVEIRDGIERLARDGGRNSGAAPGVATQQPDSPVVQNKVDPVPPNPTGDPSDIVLDETDTYENLDQNWLSIHDASGRKQTTTAIDGDRTRTAVIITLGQSNAANHGAGRYVAKHRVDNFNLYDGKCYHAEDPLLGASGEGGNFATRLGDKLIEDGLFDRVILAPIGMGGTTVEQWADEGMFNRRIPVLIRRLHDAGLNTNFVLWHQGEGNPGVGDRDGRQYRKNLLEVVGTFRRCGVRAPFFVALATLCGGPHQNAENIRAGQRGAVDPAAGIYQGPDTDIIGTEYRWDKCHFDETGLALAAALWVEAIAEFKARHLEKAT